MDRAFGPDYPRRFVAALALLPFLTGMAAEPPSSPDSQARHQKLRAVADDYWESYLRENPEVATVLGEYKYNARLTDYSLAHVDVLRTRSADLLVRAQDIDTAGLSDADRLDQQLLVRTLGDQLEFIRLKNFEMPLNQMATASVARAAATTKTPTLARELGAVLTPSAVTSNTHANTSAMGNPSMTTKMKTRRAQGGASNAGNPMEAACTRSQPTTR